MGKLTRILMLCCALAAMLAVSAAAEETDNTRIPYPVEGGNIYFNAETGIIVECDTDVTKAEIPSEINGISVTGIVADFSFHSELTEVVFPQSVRRLDAYGLFPGCAALKSVTFPRYVEIGDSAFAGCTALESVTFQKIPELDYRLTYEQVFADAAENFVIRVPESSLSQWRGSGWNIYTFETYTLTGIVADGEWGANLTWTLDADGLLTVSGEGAMTAGRSGVAGMTSDMNHQVGWPSNVDEIKKVVIEEGIQI